MFRITSDPERIKKSPWADIAGKQSLKSAVGERQEVINGPSVRCDAPLNINREVLQWKARNNRRSSGGATCHFLPYVIIVPRYYEICNS